MLTRYVVEAGDWDSGAKIPLPVPSQDFIAVKLQLAAMAAAAHKDAAGAKVPAEKLAVLAQEPGHHPFVQQIIMMQAKEAQAFAAKTSGNADEAVARMKEPLRLKTRLTPSRSRLIQLFRPMNSSVRCSWS